MLVVIAIIALLIGILLPALSRARENSKRAACLSNLRTIGQALLLYANETRDRLPNLNPSVTWSSSAQDAVLVPFAKKYLRTPGVVHCPSDRDLPPQDFETADQEMPNSVRGSYDFYSVYWPGKDCPRWSKMKQAPMAWDLDGGRAKFHPEDPHTNLQNHDIKGGNVVFADGHAEWQEFRLWDQENFPNPAAKYYPTKKLP